MRKKTEGILEKVLELINSYVDENGFPPSLREICSALNIRSTATVHYYLQKLIETGQISKTAMKSRSIETASRQLRNSPNVKVAPLIGKITAGEPILAIENFEEYIPVPSGLFNYEEMFALKVSGQSMIGAGIFDGDLVIVKKQDYAYNRDIVVAFIDDAATVKRYFKENDKFVLHPENPSMEDIILTELDILGIVVGSIRKF